MFKNYTVPAGLKIAWRNLIKNKVFSFINIAGLSIGISTCFIIMLYVQNELSFDRDIQINFILVQMEFALTDATETERNGLNLGEGAGFLVIESASSAKKRGAKVLCKLAGYANANDAYHQTASSPDGEGATTSMLKALEMSGLTTTDIDYINVHGTGTHNNDLSEGVALKRVFGESLPPFSSTKSYTGHTLGAAAAIEAVFSILALEHGVVFPNLNFSTTIEDLGISPVTQLMTGQKVNNVLSNSFGFGGNNSTLIFSK